MPLWSGTIAWFLIYFTVAYLVLLEDVVEKFDIWPFLINIIELGVALTVTLTLYEGAQPNAINTDVERLIYFGWIFIPAVAMLSNTLLRRHIKRSVSLLAAIIAAIGLFVSATERTIYPALLILMWGVLLLYMIQVCVKPDTKTLRGKIANWLYKTDTGQDAPPTPAN
jgi:hypothetical protein